MTKILSNLNQRILPLLCGILLTTTLSAEEVLPPAANAEAQPSSAVPSFRRDVMPVFFRAGCNSGTCHGSSRGKDGFRLSLFGYDPKGDYERVTREMVGRRVNTAVPEESLLLLKAIGAVPHTGGKLFAADSTYYKTLLAWIAAGAPDDAAAVPETVEVTLSTERLIFEGPGTAQKVRVTARASDGSTRDVTELARFQTNDSSVAKIDQQGQITAVGHGDTNVFARFNRFSVGAEVMVLPPEAGFTWPSPPAANFIDELVYDRLHKLRMVPAQPCDDETFLRRVTLDLKGIPPTPAEYQAFMADTGADKRARKIDELLASKEFADVWTAIWAESLKLKGGGYVLVGTEMKAAAQFYKWIRQQMRDSKPLDQFVAEMVTATGSNIRSGPANLYTMLDHKVKFRPKEFSAEFSQLFLGVQIQCAECHNHPFDRWTMDDYYSLMSFFTGVRRKNGTDAREFKIYVDPAAPPANHLLDGRPMPARVLGGETPAPSGTDPRAELARWLTAPQNDLFSRNLANRIWAQLLGRGIVEPVDDVRVSNPPVNGPLLTALAKRLVDSKFSLRALIRDICLSRTYQASITPNPSNVRDTRQFSHAHLRRLRADVLLDSLMAVSGGHYSFGFFSPQTKAIQYYPVGDGDTEAPFTGDAFLQTFGRSARGSVCTCETKREATLSQTLHLMVGNTVGEKIETGPVVKEILTQQKTADDAIKALFIRALCRLPTEEEMQGIRSRVEQVPATDTLAIYEDVLWSLMNSTEFSSNH
jgi:hypothetical protein